MAMGEPIIDESGSTHSAKVLKGKITRTYYDEEGKPERSEIHDERDDKSNNAVIDESKTVVRSESRLAGMGSRLKDKLIPKKLPREERLKRLREMTEEENAKANLAAAKAKRGKYRRQNVNNVLSVLGVTGSTGSKKGRSASHRQASGFEGLEEFLGAGQQAGNPFAGMDMVHPNDFYGFGGGMQTKKGKKKGKKLASSGVSAKEFYGF